MMVFEHNSDTCEHEEMHNSIKNIEHKCSKCRCNPTDVK